MGGLYHLSSPHHTPSYGSTLQSGPGAASEANLYTVKSGLLTLEILTNENPVLRVLTNKKRVMYLEVIHLCRVIKRVTDTSTALQRQQGDLETIFYLFVLYLIVNI